MCRSAQQLASYADRKAERDAAWIHRGGEIDERAGQYLVGLLRSMRARIDELVEAIGYDVKSLDAFDDQFIAAATVELEDALCADRLCDFTEDRLLAEFGKSDETRDHIKDSIHGACGWRRKIGRAAIKRIEAAKLGR